MKKIVSFTLLAIAVTFIYSCGSSGQLEIIQKETRIDIMIDGQLITSYMHGSKLLKPCLYPVLSPSGKVVTRAYPFEEIEGESSDHPHHTGAYFTYASKGEVNGNSFWNLHDVPPQIQHVRVLDVKEGKNSGSLSTLSQWVDGNNKPILEEKRLMEFQADVDQYRIDFTFELTATDTAVTFEDTKEGMFAIRVADWLAEDARGTLYESTGEYINAEGEKNEENIWGKRSSWVRLEGEDQGQTIGVVIYHHPSSVNYPTYWHARGYGCFAANPIGQYDFQQGRKEENPQHRTLTIEPGESEIFKFRMTIYEGSRTKAQLEEEFEEYSKH